MTQKTEIKSQKKPKNKRNPQPKKDYFGIENFTKWIALPKSLRNPKTQEEICKKYKIASSTLSRWKQKEGFWDEVKKEVKEWSRGKTPNVIQAIYQKILKQGGAAEAKLWLEYVEGWAEKSEFKGEIKNTEIILDPEEKKMLDKIIERKEKRI